MIGIVRTWILYEEKNVIEDLVRKLDVNERLPVALHRNFVYLFAYSGKLAIKGFALLLKALFQRAQHLSWVTFRLIQFDCGSKLVLLNLY